MSKRISPVAKVDLRPNVIFLHYYGSGPAEALAKAVRATVDLLGRHARRQ
jgi:hypothetical protein